MSIDPTAFEPRKHQAHPDELKDRVIMVTGAGAGIGRAVSLALARAGAHVILLGRTVRKLEAVHAEIAQLGRAEASIVPLDLEKALAKDYEAVAAAIQQRYGRLDGLLHNAALLGALTPIDQYDVPPNTCCRCCAPPRTRRCCSLRAASAGAVAPTGARIRSRSSRSKA
jgi:NAD(P)-dependent dehydrogenase (short-subunit alcohol dehydrogenase family)